MRERPANRSHALMPTSSVRGRAPQSTVLWRLRGATDDLRGLAIETSFGYALHNTLDEGGIQHDGARKWNCHATVTTVK